VAVRELEELRGELDVEEPPRPALRWSARPLAPISFSMRSRIAPMAALDDRRREVLGVDEPRRLLLDETAERGVPATNRP